LGRKKLKWGNFFRVAEKKILAGREKAATFDIKTLLLVALF